MIQKKDEVNYKIAPDQPRAVRSLPILYCLKDPRLLTAQLLAFMQAALLANFDSSIPTFSREAFGYNTLQSGLVFIALILPYLLLGPLAGWTVDKFGPKPAAVLGFGYLAPVLVLLRLPDENHQIVMYCAILALCGVGMAAIGSPSIVEAASVVEKYEKANPNFFGKNGPYASLYAVNSMVFSTGLAVGPLISGTLKDSIGYGNLHLVMAGLCLLTAFVSFVWIGGKPKVLLRQWRNV